MTYRSYRAANKLPATTPAQPRLFESKYEGTCRDCGGKISIGDKILWTPGQPSVHADKAVCAAALSAQNPDDIALMRDGWRKIANRFGGACAVCGQRTAVGTDIWYRKVAAKGEVRHTIGGCPVVTVPETAPAPAGPDAPSVIPDGRYTLVVADESAGESAYQTFRVHTVGSGKNAGRVNLAVKHAGTWVNLGRISGDQIIPFNAVYEWIDWASGTKGPVIPAETVAVWTHVANVLLTGGGVHLQAGLLYAMRCNECWHCGRELEVPASICRGVGPSCAKKLGLS